MTLWEMGSRADTKLSLDTTERAIEVMRHYQIQEPSLYCRLLTRRYGLLRNLDPDEKHDEILDQLSRVSRFT